jgi:hypothetical protein
MFNKMKPVMDERLIWFAYHKEDPVAMLLTCRSESMVQIFERKI